uniref:Uncharacterized protein n=1 Tax=Gasterosteus aculeatus TaxID=69293 RepID=G3NED5_GASAC
MRVGAGTNVTHPIETKSAKQPNELGSYSPMCLLYLPPKWPYFSFFPFLSARSLFLYHSLPFPLPQLPAAHLHAAIGGCSLEYSNSGGGVKNGSC